MIPTMTKTEERADPRRRPGASLGILGVGPATATAMATVAGGPRPPLQDHAPTPPLHPPPGPPPAPSPPLFLIAGCAGEDAIEAR